jgi:hypothetical protein
MNGVVEGAVRELRVQVGRARVADLARLDPLACGRGTSAVAAGISNEDVH